MEPRSSGNIEPNFSPEQQLPPAIRPEQLSGVLQSPESMPAVSPERSANAEHLSVDHLGQTMGPTIIQPSPTLPDPQPVATQPGTQSTTTPAVADDTDQIEQEWVAKVKQVIAATGRDPHAQQDEASRLMADYVLKRFGRKIGEAEE